MNPNMMNGQTMPDAMTNTESMHGNMTCADVMHKFKTHDCDDEMKVANKYLDYAVVFEQAGKDCFARYIFEMAYEEYTHAKFQLMLLDDEGCMVPDELRSTFSNLESRMDSLFRKS